MGQICLFCPLKNQQISQNGNRRESKPFPLVWYAYALVLCIMYMKYFPSLGLETGRAAGRFCVRGELSIHTEDPISVQIGHLEAEQSRKRVQIFESFFKNRCLHTRERRCWIGLGVKKVFLKYQRRFHLYSIAVPRYPNYNFDEVFCKIGLSGGYGRK